MSSLLSSWSSVPLEMSDMDDMMSLLDGSFMQKQLDDLYHKFQMERFQFLNWLRENKSGFDMPLIRRYDWHAEALAWQNEELVDELYPWLDQARRQGK
jgi:hypothetical protein